MEDNASNGNLEVMETELCHTLDSSKLTFYAEYEKWIKINNGQIKLQRESLHEDHQLSFEFCFEGGETFTLICPTAYPDNEDTFFVEKSSFHGMWCNTLNEFIIDSSVHLSLEDVLDKALVLYKKHSKKDVCNSSSDSETEEEMFLDDFEDAIDIDVEEKKKRWRKKESYLRALNNQPKTSDMFQGQVKDHPQQVFSSSGASGILTNDLLNIMKTSKFTGISAEPVDDNIFQWDVYLSSFMPNGFLAQDLYQIKQRFGYDFIQLQIEFMMDLYPFYPPVVKVIRPRLIGSTINAVGNLDLLKLSNWTPARDMKSVLEEIKDYLDNNIRLNTMSCRNDRDSFPQGAYLDIENHLMHLTFVSEVPISSQKNKKNNRSTKKVKKMNDGSKQFLFSFGFSTFRSTGWDVNAFLAAQKEKDNQIDNVLKNILHEIEKCCGTFKMNLTHNAANHTYSSFLVCSSCLESNLATDIKERGEDSQCSSGSSSQPSNLGSSLMSPDDDRMSQHYISSSQNEKGSMDPVDDLYNVLKDSSLLPFLESKLKVTSFLEICQHTSVYRSIVDIINAIASHPKLAPLLWHLPGRVVSVYDMVTKLEKEAESIIIRLEKTVSNGTVPQPVKNSAATTNRTTNQSDPEYVDEQALANDFYSMSHTVKHSLQNLGLLDVSGSRTSQEENMEVQISADDSNHLASTYKEALKDLQFHSCDIEVEGVYAHKFSATFKHAIPPNTSQVMRIAQELAVLSSSLPLEIGSAIFVCTDDSKITLLKALITGPEGTPYSGGCFIFDIYLNPRYPVEPPLVKFCTTAGGTVRFNPNLYACGRVCLSLLGTWNGLEGEQWLSTSTLLQVLVSIQSLILVPQPLFNEPGYECLMNQQKWKEESLKYNNQVMINTIKYAMVEQIRHPDPCFKDVIRTHFSIKKDRILKVIEDSMAEQDSLELHKAYETLKAELDTFSSAVRINKNC